MCKVCKECNGIMNYDPYFQANVCTQCGRIEEPTQAEIEKRNVINRNKMENATNFAMALCSTT